MERLHARGWLYLALIVVSNFGVSEAAGQSLWLPRDQVPSVTLEVLKPKMDFVDEGFLTFAAFLSGRLPVSRGTSLLVEIPYARFESDAGSASTLGHVYLGIEGNPIRSRIWGEAGVRFPFEDTEGAALFTGRISDVTRAEAFLENGLSLQAGLNGQARTPSGFGVRLRLVGSMPFGTAADRELFAIYAIQTLLERAAIRAGAAFSGRTWVTEDGSLGDRSETQLEFHADFGAGLIRPGIELRVPLGDLREDVPYIVGASLRFVPRRDDAEMAQAR